LNKKHIEEKEVSEYVELSPIKKEPLQEQETMLNRSTAKKPPKAGRSQTSMAEIGINK